MSEMQSMSQMRTAVGRKIAFRIMDEFATGAHESIATATEAAMHKAVAEARAQGMTDDHVIVGMMITFAEVGAEVAHIVTQDAA